MIADEDLAGNAARVGAHIAAGARALGAGKVWGRGHLLGLDIGSEVLGIVCLEDGRLSLVHGSYFSIDYRYDVETDRWVDQNERKADQEG